MQTVLFQIHHRKLCARNVSLLNQSTPKIAGIGISEFSKPGQDVNLVRWTAPETFKSKNYVSKCDVWSFGCLMWEAVTLGATPYPEIKSKDLPSRVSRGLRLPQTGAMSDDLYQMMLNCWQVDPDERPSFAEIVEQLSGLAQHGNVRIQ